MRRELRKLIAVTAIGLMTTTAMFGQTYTIGANNGSNTTTGWPCPLQDYYKTSRAQYLYLGSELTGMGMGASTINSISWTVTAPYDIIDADGGVIEGYTIKMMQTGTASLTTSGWEAGATTVWGPMDYIPVEGTNTFTLDLPFGWDGASNIIIEICGGVPTGEWEENAQVIYTTGLGFNGSRTYRSDTDPAVCSYIGTGFSGTATSRPQVIIESTPATDCAGTPTASDAVSTAGSVCIDETFTVSIDPDLATGITYQWASSADDITYTDILGATGTSYGTTQTYGTYYKCTVSCSFSGESATSAAVYVGQNAPMECYCEPTYTTGTGFGDFVSNVSLGTINNATLGAAAPFYTYYAGMSTDVMVGSEYTVDVTVGTYTNNDIAAWIDYNQDGVFDEVTEKLGEIDGLAASATGSLTFTVPGDASIGMTRLRIREADQLETIESCETLTYGETEDYDINIMSVPVDCEVATGLYADGITGTTADLHWDVTAGATNWHVTVARTDDKVIVAKIQANTNNITVFGLVPGTDYGFQARSFCVPDGVNADMSDKYYFSTPLKLGENATSANIYPNPTNGNFVVALNGYENEIFNLEVVNTLGQIVYTQILDVNANQFTYNVSLNNATPGMYQVNLNNNNKVINYTIVVSE